MSEHAPNKTVSSAGMRPVPTSNYNTSGPAHHVKKLIETYNKTAERSMAGPAAAEGPSELPFKLYSEFHHPYQSQVRNQTYKLPPDVELSKSSPDDTLKSSDDSADDDSLKVHEILPVKRTTSLDRRDCSGERHKNDLPSKHMNEEFKHIQKNGQVTLSRVGDCDRKRHGSSQSENQRAKSCDSSHSGSSGRHLTGEMIRQLQEQNKEPRIPPPPPNAQQQHLLDINASAALYEKVLQEKTYLPANQRPGHHQPAPAFKTPATAGPVFLPRDRGHTELQVTKLGGHEIFCFNIGGEKRLCLPQIINTILVHVSLHEINSVCDELRIFCATSSQDQLSRLKSAKIIPMSAAHSGLITKSDAERLCSIFLDSNPPLASMSGFRAKSSPFSFRVQHFCFGSCIGILLPEAYTSPSACCIECIECEGLFSPQKFVCHAHRNCERRTCHWGFDSANWRSYLILAEDYSKAQKDGLSKSFADFKARYMTSKRKQRDTSPNVCIPTNGIGSSNICDPIIKEEAKPINLDGPTQSKRPRIPELPLHGALPAIYQTWALNAGSGAPLHPATIAAAWSKHLSQAQNAKDKDVLGLNKALAVDLASSASLKPPLLPINVRIPDPRASRFLQNVKSSPGPEGDSPPQEFDLSSPGENHSTSSVGPLMGCSSGTPSISRTTLAEDIHAIKLSLEGATSSSREKILKILERLTARLVQAETARDNAMSQLQELQMRFEQIEDELHKKRAELREALRQESGMVGMHPARLTKVNGDGIRHREIPVENRGSVTLKPIMGSHRCNDESGEMEDSPRSSTTYIKESNFPLHHKTFRTVGLPKVDIKSPARIIEEKERLGMAEPSLAMRCRSRSPSPSSLSGAGVPPTAQSPSGSERRMYRRRSGTPASVKSRESEDLKERMLTMEAELRALREELTHRPPAKRSRFMSPEQPDDQEGEWSKQSGKNNKEVTKQSPGNGTNGGDHTLKVLPGSNGSSAENIDEKSEIDSNPVAITKTELKDANETSITDKEDNE